MDDVTTDDVARGEARARTHDMRAPGGHTWPRPGAIDSGVPAETTIRRCRGVADGGGGESLIFRLLGV